MKRSMLLVILLVAPVAFAADEMRKLDFLVGEWKGDAWIRMGGPSAKTEHIAQHEVVRPKAGGHALLIEGIGKSKLEDGTIGEVVHDALAIVSWDAAANQYRFQTWTSENRPAVPMRFEVPEPNRVVWGFDTPQGGTIRYTIRLTEAGEWHEVGEFSRDGKTFSKFFEMTLKKQ